MSEIIVHTWQWNGMDWNGVVASQKGLAGAKKTSHGVTLLLFNVERARVSSWRMPR